MINPPKARNHFPPHLSIRTPTKGVVKIVLIHAAPIINPIVDTLPPSSWIRIGKRIKE